MASFLDSAIVMRECYNGYDANYRLDEAAGQAEEPAMHFESRQGALRHRLSSRFSSRPIAPGENPSQVGFCRMLSLVACDFV